MVSVDMGVDHVRDGHALGRGEGGVRIDVPLLRVDHRALAERAAAENVGRAAGVEVIERSEDHARTLPSALVMVVRRPRLRRAIPASRAMKNTKLSLRPPNTETTAGPGQNPPSAQPTPKSAEPPIRRASRSFFVGSSRRGANSGAERLRISQSSGRWTPM